MRLIKFLLGLTIGAAAGVLLAPRSGREMRQQLLTGATGTLLPPVAEHYPTAENVPTSEETPPAYSSAAPVAGEAPEETVQPSETEAPTFLTPEAAEEIAAAEIAEMLAMAAEELAVEPEPEGAPLAEAVVSDDVLIASETVVVPVEETVEPTTPEPSPMAAEEITAPAEQGTAEPEVESQAEVAISHVAEQATPTDEIPQSAAAVIGGAEETPVVSPPSDSEDLLARIEQTRAAIEADLAEPFATTAPTEPVVEPHNEFVTDTTPVEDVIPAPEPAVEEPLATEAPTAESGISASPQPVEEPEATAPVGWVRQGEGLVADVVSPAPTEAPAPEMPPVPEVSSETPHVTAPSPAAEPVSEVPHVTAPSPAAEPVSEVPVGEPGAIDQAEMRRRIEETRARLKAKAFDAMMSGESALLRNDSGDRPVPKQADATLEPDIDSTIDESLSQEDL